MFQQWRHIYQARSTPLTAGLSCPDEVVVTYPDGVHTVVRRPDFHTSEFAKDDDPSSKGYVYPKYPYCRLWVKIAVEVHTCILLTTNIKIK
ncbi:unnamed protein product [Prunus brigantina]